MKRWQRYARAAERAWRDRRLRTSIRLYQKAAVGAERAGESDMLGLILYHLGRALDANGDCQGARDALIRARNLLSAEIDGHENLGRVLQTLGGVETKLGSFNAAVACHQDALKLARTFHDDARIAAAREQLGIALRKAGRLREAHDELTAALELARTLPGVLNFESESISMELGIVADMLHNSMEKRGSFNIARHLDEDPNIHTGINLRNLAAAYGAEGEWEKAIQVLEDAHASYLRSGDISGAGDCRALLAGLETTRGNLGRARELHEEAADLFRAGGYHRRLIDSLSDQADIAHSEERFPDAERMREEAGRLAVELTSLQQAHGKASHQNMSHKNSTEMTLDERRQLTQLEENLSSVGVDYIENIGRLIELSSRNPGSCITWIERAKGQELLRRLNMAAFTQAPSWMEIQRLLMTLQADDPAHNLLFVHYYVGSKVAVVAGMRPKRDPEIKRIEITRAELRAASASPRLAGWQATEQLLNPLVAPIEAWTAPGDRVVLCPHEILHRFPLHALEVDGEALAARNVVSYTPSAGVLRNCLVRRTDKSVTASRDAVILADASIDRPLPFARDQALALEVMLANSHWNVQCYTGQQATLGMLKNSDAPALMHFAVHGFAAPESGLDSGLQLEDGPLTARQLLRMRLNGAMICLGACDTGLGERLENDELLGLVRSALQAGARAVLASLWPVDQLSSSMLLLDFHQRLLHGETKADALRSAQLRVRDASVRDVLAYLVEIQGRRTDDPRILAAVKLAEVRLRLAAGDAERALKAVANLLSSGDCRDSEIRQAEKLRKQACLVASQRQDPDYTRRPFHHKEHWTPFILLGDSA